MDKRNLAKHVSRRTGGYSKAGGKSGSFQYNGRALERGIAGLRWNHGGCGSCAYRVNLLPQPFKVLFSTCTHKGSREAILLPHLYPNVGQHGCLDMHNDFLMRLK